MREIRLFSIILLAAAALGAQPSGVSVAGPTLAITFDRTSVIASGLKGNHPVLFFSMAVEQREFDAALVRREQLVSNTADLRARFDLPTAVPRRSVWFAVDTKNGDYGVASPPTFPLRQIVFPSDIVRRGNAKEPDALQLGFGIAEVLVVRPGGGVWGDSASRGGAHDANGGHGKLTIPVSVVRRIGTTDDIGRITPADLIIAVEPNSLAFFAGHATP